jgi:epoxyqueuosine reductase
MDETDRRALTDRVKGLARAAGFARVGVTGPDLGPSARRLRAWLDRGWHGSMDWMERTAAQRLDPRQVLPGCRAVVALSVPYDTPPPLSTEVPPDPERVWISRYAWGDDYHDVIRRMLRRLHTAIRSECGPHVALQSHTDSGPVLERVVAENAGLGWVGKNACLIDPDLGSFVFLAALLTDLPLLPDEARVPDFCGSCERCLRACPTQAIRAPGEVDARRCISYLTIEAREDIPPDLAPAVGRHAFGCDVCQDVCPWNQRARARGPQGAPCFAPREGLVHPERQKLETLWRGEFRRIFQASPVRRRGLPGLRRTLAATRRVFA